tara:strand:+ start:226 stop:621 length:396 start_codon:yes stop_codon:yes gene_type:complete
MLSSSALALLLHEGCSKSDDSKAPVVITPIEKLSKLDVCGCNLEANVILDASYELRKRFNDMDALKKDVESVDRIRSWAKNWTNLMDACFRKHGSRMWMDSECNNLVEIKDKKDRLYKLGIQIDQGEKVRL